MGDVTDFQKAKEKKDAKAEGFLVSDEEELFQFLGIGADELTLAQRAEWRVTKEEMKEGALNLCNLHKELFPEW
ncbi:MAG: hypothetical protein AAB545_00265 [Patescibacteria group bacterium]